MEFHYPLVADLLSPDEFRERITGLARESGGLIDEETAAMLVAKEMGRGPVKIAGVSTSSQLCHLFAKVLSIEEPKEIVRSDGTTTLLGVFTVGDETGCLRCLLWGERATGVNELEAGEVLEIIGRPSRLNPSEIQVMTMRPSTCEIAAVSLQGHEVPPEETRDLEMQLLSLNPPREFQRKDGTVSLVQDGLVGDATGTCRLVCWAPAVLSGLDLPCAVLLRSARIRHSARGREIHLDERSAVCELDHEIRPPITPLAEVSEGEICSVEGSIESLEAPRCFTTREGGLSWLRRLSLKDGSGRMQLVLWGEAARMPLIAGERISAYHLFPKRDRGGDLELSAGKDAAILVHRGIVMPVLVEGTVVPGLAGDLLSCEDGEYLLQSASLPAGAFVRVEGRADGRRLEPERWEVLRPAKELLLSRFDLLLESLRG